jgi:D-alanyl-D-alanine carboxypeptidase
MTALARSVVFLSLFLSLPLLAAAGLTERLDAIASKQFKENEPGAAVLVMKSGTPLLRKGYGMADLEQGIRMTPGAVIRLGSITKQFTAVAVLQLVESGRIALNDPITKYLPDAPTHGKTITVEHLLTHTSGIPSYTGKAEFRKRVADDLKPKEIVEVVQKDPLEFDPGTKWSYNNSGYVLLGMLIESVSGMPYAEYLEKNVYPRAGLTSTRYGDNKTIVPGRVPGYSRGGGKIVNAGYLSMTIPYAAGALLSTVDDLARWNAAVAAGKVVDRKLIDKAWTPYRLADGESTGYGYGWRMASLAGERVIQHGGTIHGYATHALWLPEHEVYVAVLANDQTVDPDFVSGLLALEAIGKPWLSAEIPVKPEELTPYAGVYRVDETMRRTIIVENGRLYSQRDGSPRFELFPVAKDRFRFRETFSTVTFERDAAGNVTAMIFDSGSSKSRGAKTDEKPVTRTTIAIDPAKLDRYIGKYQMTSGNVLTILRKDGGLAGIAGGGREVQLYPESESKWFAKTIDVVLEFTFDDQGKANGLTMLQGGQSRPLKRIE